MERILDRNDLGRLLSDNDDRLILSSEVVFADWWKQDNKEKERLHPGKILLIDTKKKTLTDEELKEKYATKEPYGEWFDMTRSHNG